MREEQRRPSTPDSVVPASGGSAAQGRPVGETGGDDQRKFQFLAENARDAIVVVSRKGDFLYVNRRAYELTGYTEADRTRTSLADLVPREEIDRVFALRAARHSGGTAPERYETSILTRSGQTIPVEITVAETAWQGLHADVVILRDITERKRAEEALRRRDAVLEAINFATEAFVTSPTSDERIHEAIGRLGRVMEVHRVSLAELKDIQGDLLVLDRLLFWTDPAQDRKVREDAIETLSLPKAGLEPYLERLSQGRAVQGRLSTLPDRARSILDAMGVQSFLVAPVLMKQELWGILALADHLALREWSALDVEALIVAANILGALIHRRKTEEALRESEEKYRSLVEAPNLSIVTLDRNGAFHFANGNAAITLGIAADEIVGKTMWDLFPKEFADRHIQPLRDALDSKQFAVFETPTVVQGRETWREVRIQPLFEFDGSCDKALVIANDISERKEIEEKVLSYQERLRSLTSDLLLTEERERRRIAGELHDRIGQALAISKMKLGALIRETAGGQAEPALREVRSLIDQTIKDTRSLTFDLSPPILHELGLEPAVEWLVDRLRDEYGFDATFQDDGRQLSLGEDCRILLFQSVQELLMNVMRHSQARRVEVSIHHKEDEIEIVTKDDGIGFDADQIIGADGGPTGYGLFSIRERLSHLGGQLAINSRPGSGSRITLRASRLMGTRQYGEE